MLLLEAITQDTQVTIGAVTALLTVAWGCGSYVRGSLRTDAEQERKTTALSVRVEENERRAEQDRAETIAKRHELDKRLDRLERSP